MGFFNNLRENYRIRIKPNTDARDNIPISRKGNSLVDILSDSIESETFTDISSFDEFRTLSESREVQYRIYDEMKNDSVISAALELYADDATQYNRDGSVIWADSDSNDPNVASFANRIIDMLQLNTNAWSHIYNLCLYGDIYLETFTDDPSEDDEERIVDINTTRLVKKVEGYKLEEYIEMYSNPCEIYDLVSKGKTIGFIKVKSSRSEENTLGQNIYKLQEETRERIYDPTKYIHISLYQNTDRFPEKVIIPSKDSKGNYKQIEYKVKRGKSILHDIYKIYQELKLMEDSLMLNRITRSSIIRLMQVEVGDSTKSQVNNILKRLKQMIEQRTMLNKNEGTFKNQASPGPIDNIIYIPTRNGKGTVSMSNIGGDVDIKSIVDIDHFSNKLYAGLKTPKQFLGQTDDAAGFNGGTSLTKLDSRYARTIKRIQNAYIQGITTVINIFALDKGLDDYVNNFTVRMVSPSTTEDTERDETMSSRMSIISDFIELLGDKYDESTVREIFEYLVDMYLSDNKLSEILKKDESKPEGEEDDISDSNSDDEERGFGTVDGNDFDSSDIPDNFEFSEEPDDGEDLGFDDESSEENTEEFGSYEDEY